MSSNDEFFMLDDPRYYWNDLKAKEKLLLVIPNTEHSLISGIFTIVPAATAFFRSMMLGIPRPTITTKIDYQNGDIYLESSEKPSKVKIWHATTKSSKRIDWR